MKTLNILSYGGGVQSTALLFKILNKEIDIKLDYIIFSDTGNENKLLYTQIYKIIDIVKQVFKVDIIVTKNAIENISLDTAIELINNKIKYRYSKYDDLYQSHLLYFKGYIKYINLMPLWIRKPNGKIGKTGLKQCTNFYKISQIMKEIRKQEKVKTLGKKYNINMLLGFSNDEISRLKPNPINYVTNVFPLIDLDMSKEDCREYIKTLLGFTPISSVCNMCYANDFNRVYNIYKYDFEGWLKLVDLDNAMNDKSIEHPMKNQCFMFRFQALDNIRLKDIDLELYKDKYNNDQTYKREQEMACMGGCFL